MRKTARVNGIVRVTHVVEHDEHNARKAERMFSVERTFP
jgi:hypothetical protein